MSRAVVLLALCAACGAGEDEVASLVDMSSWQLVDPACEPSAVEVEGDSIHLNTALCDPIVVTQPLRVDLSAGDQIWVSCSHGRLSSADGGTGRMTVTLDGEVLLDHQAPIPHAADSFANEVTLSRDIARGAPVVVDVRNHGSNYWMLVSLERR